MPVIEIDEEFQDNELTVVTCTAVYGAPALNRLGQHTPQMNIVLDGIAINEGVPAEMTNSGEFYTLTKVGFIFVNVPFIPTLLTITLAQIVTCKLCYCGVEKSKFEMFYSRFLKMHVHEQFVSS